MDGCEVYIEGESNHSYDGWYYIPCNSVQYLDSKGINSYSSSVTAYQSIGSGGNSVNRVVFPTYGQAYYRPANGQTYTYFTIESVKFNGIGNFYRELDLINAGCMFLISVAVVLRIFRK